jgi:hypothetical protein
MLKKHHLLLKQVLDTSRDQSYTGGIFHDPTWLVGWQEATSGKRILSPWPRFQFIKSISKKREYLKNDWLEKA